MGCLAGFGAQNGFRHHRGSDGSGRFFHLVDVVNALARLVHLPVVGPDPEGKL